MIEYLKLYNNTAKDDEYKFYKTEKYTNVQDESYDTIYHCTCNVDYFEEENILYSSKKRR